jgi:CxxC-x17-CxxC domain-containing protein
MVLGEKGSLRSHEKECFLYSDKTLVCADCRQEFTFTASEQQFYADRQFSEPRRCAADRAARKAARNNDDGYGQSSGGGYGGGYSSGGSDGAGYSSGGGYSGGGYERGAREMFAATCASCGKEAQVPFRPNGTKPVYCSDCFRTQRAAY